MPNNTKHSFDFKTDSSSIGRIQIPPFSHMPSCWFSIRRKIDCLPSDGKSRPRPKSINMKNVCDDANATTACNRIICRNISRHLIVVISVAPFVMMDRPGNMWQEYGSIMDHTITEIWFQKCWGDGFGWCARKRLGFLEHNSQINYANWRRNVKIYKENLRVTYFRQGFPFLLWRRQR